jgi:type I restriction enzyme S subunit
MNKPILTSLGDIVNFRRGHDLTHDNMEEGNIPVVGSNGVIGFHNEYTTCKPCLTIGRSGSVGEVYFLDSDCWAHNTTLYVDDFKDNHPKYVYYLLKNFNFAYLHSGSVIPSLNRNYIHPLKLPYYEETVSQQKIASALSALDAKIELNNRINAELEAMAKSLYDYWFVQFDFPFDFAQGKPDENGKPYKSSGGKMVYNAELKREIPDGWDYEFVENLLAKEDLGKKIPAKEYKSNGKFPIIDQSTDFICGFTDDETALINFSRAHIVFGDHTRILKFINFDFARGADGTQVLLSNNKRMPQHLFYQSLLKIDLSNYGYARHFKFLKDAKIIVPSKDISEEYEKTATTIYQKIRYNIFENQHLTGLRDWLLPMLMNGQVRVK